MEPTDATFVARARTGDTDAFRMLVERHSHRLFRLAYRMTGNPQDAEDIVQESFLRAYRNLSQLDDRATFGTWLYRIAANCSLDMVRSRYQRPVIPASSDTEDAALSLPAPGPTPERAAFSAEILERVEDALADLSAMERTAFVLRHYEGMGIDEVGRVLGCNTAAAKHSVFRAVHKLRRALEPLASSAR